MLKKIILSVMAVAILILPNMAFAEENNVTVITDDLIKRSVQAAVQEHGGKITEPLIIDTGLIDASSGTQVSIYVLPDSNSNPLVRSLTPISAITIKQGYTMYWSKSDGDPWTVQTTTKLSMTLNANRSGETNMTLGHINATTGYLVASINSNGESNITNTKRIWTYSHTADTTSIRFYATNYSGSDLEVYGEIIF